MEYNITYRKKDGGWQYIISFKENGKWRQRSKQGFRTRAIAKIAADDRLDELKEEVKNQANISKEQKDITFKDFFKQLIEHEKLHKEQNTIMRYETAYTHFKDIYDMPMNKITIINIQKCIDDMIKKGLANSTIKTYTSTIMAIFNSAIYSFRIIIKNPVEGVKLPKSKKQEKEVQALTRAELRNLFKELDGYVNEPEYVSALLAGTCGLRVGEVLGLTWDNVDFKNAALNIAKQWKRIKNDDGDTVFGFGTLKSEHSYRTIPMPPNTLTRLKQYRKNYPTDINNRVVLYKNPISLTRDLPRKFDMVGYNITMHTLRHTYATLLIANGTDFKTAAKLLGHDVEMTMKTYSHVTDDMLDKATKTVNLIFK